MLVREYRRAKEAISKFAVHDCRGAVGNPVLLVGVKNRDVECGETGFLGFFLESTTNALTSSHQHNQSLYHL
jgi:hypothetical protein